MFLYSVCISIVSLYFFEKYDVVVAVVVYSQTAFDVQFALSFWGVWKRFECCLLNILPICCSFYIWEKRFFCPSHLVMVYVGVHCLTGVFTDYFIYIFFLTCPFFCKACFRWLSSVCKCSCQNLFVRDGESSMYKWIDSWLFFCAGWWCDSTCIYPYCWFSVHLMT